MTQRLPTVVICGRPNVGKSSLFNALLKRRVAIVDPTAGVTRDRVAAQIERFGAKFQLVDTGGLGLFDEIQLKDEVEYQIGIALDLADLVLFVVDAKDGLMPHDAEIARRLRTLKKPIMLVANKADGSNLEREAAQFLRLGLGDPVCVSALERLNIDGLLEDIVDHLRARGLVAPRESENDSLVAANEDESALAFDDESDGLDPDIDLEDLERMESAVGEEAPPTGSRTGPIQIAIVGKVNSGKSTFVNRVVGENRVIVSPIAGTTRDAIDAPFVHKGQEYVAIDTAGLRKRRVVENTPDFYGVSRANEAIRRADVVLLFVDSERDVSQIDKSLAQVVARSTKPVVVAVTKWDLATAQGKTAKDYLPYLHQQLPLLEFAPVVFLSTHTGQNVGKILDVVKDVYEQAGFRAPTGVLNRVLEQAFAMEKPRVGRGKFPKVLYLTQTRVRPPTFVVFVNEAKLFGDEWARFLANRLRETFPFSQVPLRIHFRERKRVPGRPGGDAPPAE